ncbi:MAG: hypothetical protein IKJ19_02910 [Clostridia bacterium]|nr:hypothetical protein [Clostridia bacterium]
MNKKLILLMLALPLILMLCLFTATSTVSLAIKVAVSKVELNEDAVVYIDLDETYDISYTVYPTNAANQNVSFSAEPVENSTTAIVKIEGNTLSAESCGKVKITVTTVDGGYKDSFIVEISTSKLQGISSSIEKDTIKLGESIDIKTTFSPLVAQYQTQLKYEVIEGVGVVSVNSQGIVTAENVGSAKIKVYCTINNDVYDEVSISVENSYAMEFLKKNETITTKQLSGEIKLFVDENASINSYSLEVLDKNGENYNAITYNLSKENKTLSYQFTNQDACTITLRLTVTTDYGTFTDECEIVRIGKIEASWVVKNDPNGDYTKQTTIIFIGDSGAEIYFEVQPSNLEIKHQIELSENGKFISCEVRDGYLLVKASENALENLNGSSYVVEIITLTIWLDNQPNDIVTLTLTVNVLV